MRTTILCLIVLTTFLVSLNAQIKSGDNVVVDEKTNSDVYLTGGTVTINAPINGDLIAAGGTIIRMY